MCRRDCTITPWSLGLIILIYMYSDQLNKCLNQHKEYASPNRNDIAIMSLDSLEPICSRSE